MRFAFFLGCNIPARVQHYDISARAVLEKLDVQVTDIREFNCCGYPMRNADFETAMLFAVRNLALAEKEGLNMMTLCKCCFGNLKKANHMVREDSALLETLNNVLAGEGLRYKGGVEVAHFLSVLHGEIGTASIKEKVTRPFTGLNIATHYGCHALRPSEITQFDDPVAPVIFDELVAVTGARSIDWPLKLECCGAPLLGMNDGLSMDLTERKLRNGKDAGADFLCAACPWCQLQFDQVQKMMASGRGGNHALPCILYPQLLGLSMGMEGSRLGLGMNVMDIGGITAYVSEESEESSE
jgi:heterodisulfide reductase subunit B